MWDFWCLPCMLKPCGQICKEIGELTDLHMWGCSINAMNWHSVSCRIMNSRPVRNSDLLEHLQSCRKYTDWPKERLFYVICCPNSVWKLPSCLKISFIQRFPTFYYYLTSYVGEECCDPIVIDITHPIMNKAQIFVAPDFSECPMIRSCTLLRRERWTLWFADCMPLAWSELVC